MHFRIKLLLKRAKPEANKMGDVSTLARLYGGVLPLDLLRSPVGRRPSQ
jgi:hypothetical protein